MTDKNENETNIFNNERSILKTKIRNRYSNNNIKKENEEYFCFIHNSNYKIYCSKCEKDICIHCKKESHNNHKLICYKDILPDLKEIIIVKKAFIEYESNFKKILKEIENWKEKIKLLIISFKNQIQTISKIINNFDTNKINFNGIYKFRYIFEKLTSKNDESSKNKKILKIISYNFSEENNNNESNDKQRKQFENILTIQKLNEFLNSIIKTDDILKKSNIILETLTKIKYNDSYFIEIDTATSSNSRNNSLYSTNSFLSYLSSNECNNIFLDNSKKNDDAKNISRIYSRKKIKLENNEDKDKEKNKKISSFDCKDKEKKVNYNDKEKPKNNNKLIKIQNIINKTKLFKSFNDNNSCSNINIMKKLNFKSIQNKISKSRNIPKYSYLIKKNEIRTNFDSYMTQRNSLYNSINNLLNDINIDNNYKKSLETTIKQNSEIFPKKNFLQIYLRNKLNNKIFVHRKYSSLRDRKNNSNSENSKNNSYNNIYMTSKNNSNNKIKIESDENQPLNIGLELSNTECKIGLFNKKEKGIEIFKFSESGYGIPTIISFDSNKNIVKIGEEVNDYKNKGNTFFNLIKLIGVNIKEIKDSKKFWPFQIYDNIGNDTSNRYPSIKVSNFKGKKYVYYTIEDLLAIYLQKLFELFFSKIIINNEELTKITMNIVITVPNYYSYIQRKIIERIFKNKLFSQYLESNLNYNGYNITVNNLLIENVSNLASFCLNNHNYYISDISKYSNILLLYIDGGSVNLSIVSISEKMNKNKNYHSYQIKGIGGLNFGEEDITNNFMKFCLSDFNEDILISCFKNFKTYERLRISCKKVEEFFNKNEINQTEININKFYDKIDLKIIINRKDYHKCCCKYFEKIKDLIKKTLKESKIKENDIDDIILIGNITKNYMLRKIIYEIFINNKKIIKGNSFEEKMEYYPVAGAILQSLNSSLLFPNYKLINITNLSFGVECFDGLKVFGIIKGKEIPYKNNVLVKIKKQSDNNSVKVNIYEGENKYAINNKLICSENVVMDDIKNDMDYHEILFQFSIDLNNNLNVFILDSNSFQIKHKFEKYK